MVDSIDRRLNEHVQIQIRDNHSEDYSIEYLKRDAKLGWMYAPRRNEGAAGLTANELRHIAELLDEYNIGAFDPWKGK